MPIREMPWHFNQFKKDVLDRRWSMEHIGDECRRFFMEEFGYTKSQLVSYTDDYIRVRLGLGD